MKTLNIDINADVGEGIGQDKALMPFLSSCNIACGGHVGDRHSMKETIALAQEYGVNIGAHPSYPDRINFGRKPLQMSNSDLLKSLISQIHEFRSVLDDFGAKLNHIKPHGALYNKAVVDQEIALVIVELMKTLEPKVKLYVPYASKIETLALEQNVPIVYEAFADRNYLEDLRLVSRQDNNAMITQPQHVYEHCLSIIKNNKVVTRSGKEVFIKASTICVHGDTKTALQILMYLHQQFKIEGIEVC